MALVALFSSSGGIFAFPFSRLYYLAMLSSQVTAGALFIVQLRPTGQVEAASLSVPKTTRNAFILAAGSMVVLFLLLLIKAWAWGMSSSTWLLPGDNG